jgi:hypothetical protein
VFTRRCSSTAKLLRRGIDSTGRGPIPPPLAKLSQTSPLAKLSQTSPLAKLSQTSPAQPGRPKTGRPKIGAAAKGLIPLTARMYQAVVPVCKEA